MKLFLCCYSELVGEWLPASDPRCGYTFDPKYWVIECDHAEDWGSPVGGLVPCDALGNILPEVVTTNFNVAYFAEE